MAALTNRCRSPFAVSVAVPQRLRPLCSPTTDPITDPTTDPITDPITDPTPRCNTPNDRQVALRQAPPSLPQPTNQDVGGRPSFPNQPIRRWGGGPPFPSQPIRTWGGRNSSPTNQSGGGGGALGSSSSSSAPALKVCAPPYNPMGSPPPHSAPQRPIAPYRDMGAAMGSSPTPPTPPMGIGPGGLRGGGGEWRRRSQIYGVWGGCAP